MPDAQGWAIVAYAGLLPSLVSQILYVRGVELIGPNRAGLFINTIINFLIVALALFVMIRAINRLQAKAPEAPAAPPEDVTLLREIRDLLKTRS